MTLNKMFLLQFVGNVAQQIGVGPRLCQDLLQLLERFHGRLAWTLRDRIWQTHSTSSLAPASSVEVP